MVENVEPHHVAASLMAVIVRRLRWRDHEVPDLHVQALPIDGGEGAAALDDEARSCR